MNIYQLSRIKFPGRGRPPSFYYYLKECAEGRSRRWRSIKDIAFAAISPYPYMTMNQDQLKEYKIKLERERMMIAAEIARDEKPVDFGSDIDHDDEATDKSEEVGNQLAAAGELKGRLTEIDIALGKIQNGTYGVCEKCGKPIEQEILAIDPESRFCKACKLAI
jgi:DnaK suppressor protein